MGAGACSLEALLTRLKPYGPIRCICILPGGSAILETQSDSSQWTFATSEMPSGKTLLTAKIPGGPAEFGPSFEMHLDVNKATSATLGVSPKTGGAIVRILDAEGASLLTLLPSKDSSFLADMDDGGEELALVRES